MLVTVAVLGTGIMGAPMARNLLAAGHDVRVWNRTSQKARPLADDGAVVADTPGEAATGADVLLTMLADGPAVDAVIDDASAPLGVLPDGAVWAQMSTVGADWSDRLAARAERAGVAIVDAPVLGTRQPAEDGALVVLAGGDDGALERCAPVFEAVGRATHRAGGVGAASRLKLVINAWLVTLVAGLAEAVVLAERLDVAPDAFLDVIDGGPIGPAYARIKGDMMIAGAYPTAFPLDLALKDARLVAEAADRAGLELRVVQAIVEEMAKAVQAGHGRQDMSAVVEALRHG